MNSTIAEHKHSLRAALRDATAASHMQLEASLALIQAATSRTRILAILQGFWGFHAVWEPLVRAKNLLPAHLASRTRLALVRQDLAGLGMAENAIDSLSLCKAALALGSSPARALGTSYVLEGSTLGGQVINRALADAPWAPPGGLRYFAPYGENTGAMWREMLETLADASGPESDSEIIAGAVETFDLLHNWFTRDLAI